MSVSIIILMQKEMHDMSILICGVCVILLFMCFYWLTVQLINAIYIKFNSCVSFYNINPDRWILYDNNVGFVKERSYCSSDRIYYKFHFIDFYRYKHWHKKLIKQKRLEKEISYMNEMILIVKKDIAKLEEENQARMQSAAKNIREITSRM